MYNKGNKKSNPHVMHINTRIKMNDQHCCRVYECMARGPLFFFFFFFFPSFLSVKQRRYRRKAP